MKKLPFEDAACLSATLKFDSDCLVKIFAQIKDRFLLFCLIITLLFIIIGHS